jgi:hypothetical protein
MDPGGTGGPRIGVTVPAHIPPAGFVAYVRRAEPPKVLAGVRNPRSLRLAGQVAQGTVLAEPVPPSTWPSSGPRPGQTKTTRSSATTWPRSTTTPAWREAGCADRWR